MFSFSIDFLWFVQKIKKWKYIEKKTQKRILKKIGTKNKDWKTKIKKERERDGEREKRIVNKITIIATTYNPSTNPIN